MVKRAWFFIPVLAGLLLVAMLGPASAAPAKISVMLRQMAGMPGGMDTEQWLKTAVAEFEAANPGIDVEVRTIVNEAYEEKMTAEFLGGVAPDVLEMYGSAPVSWAEAGFLLDLGPYVNKDLTKADVADFFPGQWQVGQVPAGARKGMRFGLPRYTNTDIMYWNKGYFQEAGLSSPLDLHKAGAWNWDAVLAAAKKLTKTNGDTVARYGYRFEPSGGRWNRWVQSNGGRAFAWPESPYEFVMDKEPKAIEALEFLQGLTYKSRVSPPDHWNTKFTAGAVGMEDQWGTCCIVSQMQAIKDTFEWDVAPIPTGPAGKAIGWIANDLWGINKASKYPDAAWQFVKFLTNRKTMESAARYLGLMPARMSAMRSYMDLFPKLSVMQAMEPAGNAGPQVYDLLPNAAKVSGLLEGVIEKIYFGNSAAVSVNQSIAAVAPAIRAAVQGK